MTINRKDAQILSRAGFTQREISEIASATDPNGNPQPPIDLHSPAWQATLHKRESFAKQVRWEYMVSHKKPLSRPMYEQIVNQWYKKGVKKSPWDWLKAEYKRKSMPDFMVMARHRAQAKIESLRKEFRRK